MKGPRMSLAEIQALDLREGERVRVIWSGGNGPYEYTLTERNGAIYTQDEWEAANGAVDSMKTLFWMQHAERVEGKGEGGSVSGRKLREALRQARVHVYRQLQGRHEQDRAEAEAWLAQWGDL